VERVVRGKKKWIKTDRSLPFFISPHVYRRLGTILPYALILDGKIDTSNKSREGDLKIFGGDRIPGKKIH
jgi:hypothetical protein